MNKVNHNIYCVGRVHFGSKVNHFGYGVRIFVQLSLKIAENKHDINFIVF